jgi:endonuclease-8
MQALVGQRVEVETPHPRARAAVDVGRLDGRRLDAVDAHGKNLLFRFEGGVVLRSHLGASGRWQVRLRADARPGARRPWLVLRSPTHEATLWNARVLELHARALARMGPDILAAPPDLDAITVRLRLADGTRFLGESLLDQTIVAGVGNMWLAEALWEARLSPWRRLRDVSEGDRRRALATCARLMRSALDGGRPRRRQVYRRPGRPCPRCGTPIRSFPQGDGNRLAYWCPGCQVGDDPAAA